MEFIRSVDELGRITIPKELRTLMGIKEGTKFKLTRKDNKLILERHISAENVESAIEILKRQLNMSDIDDGIHEETVRQLNKLLKEIKKEK